MEEGESKRQPRRMIDGTEEKEGGLLIDGGVWDSEGYDVSESFLICGNTGC